MSQSQRQHPRKWSQARDQLFFQGNQPNLREELPPTNSHGVGAAAAAASAAAEVHRELPPPPAQSKKGTPWTVDEHLLFLHGLRIYGKGEWKSISRHCVKSRTPSQIASHAQKYFLRQNPPVSEKKRKRKSIHDITLREPIQDIPIGQPIRDIPIAIREPIHDMPIGHDIAIREPIHDINLGDSLVPPLLDHHNSFPHLQNWELYTPNWLLPPDTAMQQLQEFQQAQETFNSNPPNYLPQQGYEFGNFNNHYF